MTGLEARRAALDLAERVRDGATLQDALDDCPTFTRLEGPDRGFARAMATQVLRRRGTLDHILGAYIDRPLPKKAARIMDILRLAAAQALFMQTPAHAVVSTAVELTRDRRETGGYAKLVNAVARKVAKNGAALLAKTPARADTPAWLWRSWERAYGPQAARAIAAAHRVEPPLDLTVKDEADARAWADRLGAELLANGTLRLARSQNITALTGFEEGAWWVQDFAASLPARLLGEVSGKRVFDLCAAPGGKTLQLAGAGASVVAVDKAEQRLKRLRENLARTRLSAELIEEDILRWKPDDKADAILLDAPCTATGTIRRHPDIAWSKSETDVAALTSLQAKMIDRATALLKPGGVLVFCVCSLQPEEGEKQVEAALGRNKALSRAAVTPGDVAGVAGAVTPKGDLRTLPSMLAAEGGMDGFFAARLRLSG